LLSLTAFKPSQKIKRSLKAYKKILADSNYNKLSAIDTTIAADVYLALKSDGLQ